MRTISITTSAYLSLVSDLERRFSVGNLDITSSCPPGHLHDGDGCGLDLTAHQPDVPTVRAELVAALPDRCGPGTTSVSWVHADDHRLMARLAAAYLAALDDPRLAQALDDVEAAWLCAECGTVCSLDSGPHSVERAVLEFTCGTPERMLAIQLLPRWSGSGRDLFNLVAVATR